MKLYESARFSSAQVDSIRLNAIQFNRTHSKCTVNTVTDHEWWCAIIQSDWFIYIINLFANFSPERYTARPWRLLCALWKLKTSIWRKQSFSMRMHKKIGQRGKIWLKWKQHSVKLPHGWHSNACIVYMNFGIQMHSHKIADNQNKTIKLQLFRFVFFFVGFSTLSKPHSKWNENQGKENKIQITLIRHWVYVAYSFETKFECWKMFVIPSCKTSFRIAITYSNYFVNCNTVGEKP